VAFWPGTVVVTVTAGPPGTMVPVTSGGTSKSVTVVLPIPAPWGSTTTVYVPVLGSVIVSRKPPPIPKFAGFARAAPFGFSTEILTAQQAGPIDMLTRWPATPLKVILAFWPGTVVVTVTAAPPGTAVAVTSGGTSYRRRVAPPVPAFMGSTTMV
jgi:hypothetical protein